MKDLKYMSIAEEAKQRSGTAKIGDGCIEIPYQSWLCCGGK